MPTTQPFSRRNNFNASPAEIKVREDAPEEVRVVLIQTAYACGWGPDALRSIICRILHKRPDPGNWSAYPNIDQEVRYLVDECAWFKVYDIIEAVYDDIADGLRQKTAKRFADDINAAFLELGIGWKLENGQIISRGDDEYEIVLKEAAAALDASGRPTAHSHLQEARQALSRRPKPNLSGAVYHAMGSLEAVARDLSGTPKATLGEILKRHDIVPKPLDTALSQMWGYASNEARHVEEGREPTREEAELVVGIAAAMVTYLSKKAG
jgi:hypothetical protein